MCELSFCKMVMIFLLLSLLSLAILLAIFIFVPTAFADDNGGSINNEINSPGLFI
ncbi:hypothetical protein GCM10009131_06120 [Morganella psychrotolerans]